MFISADVESVDTESPEDRQRENRSHELYCSAFLFILFYRLRHFSV